MFFCFAMVLPSLTPAEAGAQTFSISRDLAMDRQPAVYILASRRNGTLYVGVTSNLPARIWQHRTDLVEGFSKEHRVHTLVYYEMHESMIAAITREKQIKEWKRFWKLRLIESGNPEWRDLFDEICR
jgi:putative endonuclease